MFQPAWFPLHRARRERRTPGQRLGPGRRLAAALLLASAAVLSIGVAVSEPTTTGMLTSLPLATTALAILFGGIRRPRTGAVSSGAGDPPAGEPRRYVPGPVAHQLARGDAPRTGEFDASVLFADLHGYTGFAEFRQPQEVFRLLDRFTHGVSRIVQEEGGWIVDFHGDGLLAVFGAPEPLPQKERSAVRAARRIVRLSEALDETAPLRGGGSRAVTVGIATGAAFLGCIHTVDRLIWSTTGDTTNVAARLQEMTHRLGVAILADSETCRRATVRNALSFPSLEIRGRVRRLDAYGIQPIDGRRT